MGIPLLGILGKVLKPAFGFIDDITTTDEERLAFKVALTQIEADLKEVGYDYDKELASARASVILAEANSQSWLARNWRPIVMITFAAEIVLISTGTMDVDSLVQVPEQMWRLLQIGIGGYIVGRSAEKIVPQVFNNKKKETVTT
jgi:hypothetical protein